MQRIGSPGSTRRRLLARCLVAVLAAVVALLGAEFVLRWQLPARRWLREPLLAYFEAQAVIAAGQFAPDAELGHVPLLGGRHFDAYGLATSQGLRHGPARRPGVARVLFLGDSVTARSRIVRPLQALWGGGPVEFLNAGIEGANPVQSVGIYFRHQRALEPDHVVLTLHNNDLTMTTTCLRDGQGTLRLCNPGELTPLSPDLYRWSVLYRLWLDTRHTNYTVPERYLSFAEPVANSLRRLRDDVVGSGARLTVLLLPILAPQGRWEPHQREAYGREKQMLAELAIETIDLLPACEALIGTGAACQEQPDDVWHPNDAAGAWLALAAARAGLIPAARGIATAAETILDAGATQTITVDAGPDCAGCTYVVLGSQRGLTTPVDVLGVQFSLIPDAYLRTTLTAGAPFRGVLDGDGRATIVLPAATPTAGAGVLCWHTVAVQAKSGAWLLGSPLPMLVRKG